MFAAVPYLRLASPFSTARKFFALIAFVVAGARYTPGRGAALTARLEEREASSRARPGSAGVAARSLVVMMFCEASENENVWSAKYGSLSRL